MNSTTRLPRNETLSYMEDMIGQLRDLAIDINKPVLAHILQVAMIEATRENNASSHDAKNSAA